MPTSLAATLHFMWERRMPRQPDRAAAETFIWTNARLIDRRRYLHLFKAGAAETVLAALRAHQNADGGFGHALEPDLRGPLSEPLPVDTALRILDEIDRFDDPMVSQACDYLTTITTPEGGVPFLLPTARDYPLAPYVRAVDNPPASLLPTASIVGLLHKHRVRHGWLDRATDYCWQRLERFAAPGAYELRAVFLFLEHAPDRARAEAAFARIGPQAVEKNLVALDPNAPGEVHTPLDFAPTPASLARRLFSDAVMKAHLDALAAAQQADGGWLVNWKIWTPATGTEWRAWATIRALLTLRAYERLP
jgi:hypothetical protein